MKNNVGNGGKIWEVKRNLKKITKPTSNTKQPRPENGKQR